MAKAVINIDGETGDRIVALEMNDLEANTLMVILEHINGDANNSPRRETDAVWRVLVNATGANPDELPQHSLMANHEALGFAFKNYDGTTPSALQAQIDAEQRGEQAYAPSDDLETFLNSLLP